MSIIWRAHTHHAPLFTALAGNSWAIFCSEHSSFRGKTCFLSDISIPNLRNRTALGFSLNMMSSFPLLEEKSMSLLGLKKPNCVYSCVNLGYSWIPSVGRGSGSILLQMINTGRGLSDTCQLIPMFLHEWIKIVRRKNWLRDLGGCYGWHFCWVVSSLYFHVPRKLILHIFMCSPRQARICFFRGQNNEVWKWKNCGQVSTHIYST